MPVFRFRSILALSVLPPLMMMVAACGDKTGSDEVTDPAAGEVLEGTISDAMISFDRLRSQPPFEVEETAPARASSVNDASDQDANGADTADEESSDEQVPDQMTDEASPGESEAADE